MIAPAEPAVSSPKLLDRVRWHLRVKHYSIRTEQAYVDWIRRFILFHKKSHPDKMGEEEIAAFLSHLAIEGQVAASTQNQALSALLFLISRSSIGNSISSREWSVFGARPNCRSFLLRPKRGAFSPG